MSEFIRHMKAAYGASGLVLNESELALINQHTLREYTADELFAFKVTACDNEIDRDTEVFTTATLRQIAKMIQGKTVISDHQWSAEKQCARIYAARVVTESNQMTGYGDPYARLELRCYMPRSEDTKSQIDLIESGILKEVSIGCSTEKNTCSICRNSYYSSDCIHRRGEAYDGKKCYVMLENARDAFEISFTPVPAQPAAGVTKAAKEQEPSGSFKAELEGLTAIVKEIGAAVGRLEKAEKPAPKAPEANTKGAQTQDNAIDPEADALIRSANALINSMEGDF